MEVKKYDRENDATTIGISVDELEVIATAFRLATCQVDERNIVPVTERESTPEGIVELAFCTNVVRDILKRLPGEIDATIEFYKNPEGG